MGVTSANANGGVLQLKSGITFPATVVESTDANTLDDYEEGTWTPQLKPDGVFGAWPTSTNTGKYIKIGKQVFVECIITWTAKTNAGNYIFLTGFPFAPSATTPYNYVTVFEAASNAPYAMQISADPYGKFIRSNALGAFGPLIGTELGNATGSLQFGITYNIS